MTKRVLTMLLALALVLGLGAPASAAEETVVRVNPLYEGVVTETELLRLARESDAAPAAAEYYFATVREAGEYVRSQMKNRTQSVSFIIPAGSGGSQALSDQIFDVAVEHTGDPTEGDYLQYQYGGYSGTASSTWYNGRQCRRMSYNVLYYTTAAQERAMDAAVSGLLLQLGVSGKSSYERVKAIYDYICGHVTYDHAHLYDAGYKLQYTAYAGLMNGTCVCQGYATLLYRLALEAGVDCRIVTNQDHAWNILRLGGQYYYADSTWDSELDGRYEYFLRGGDDFGGHGVMEPQFYSAQWKAQYPMSARDYEPGADRPSQPDQPSLPDRTRNGWFQDSDGVWYFYKNGEVMKNYWVLDGSAHGLWYHMGADGTLDTGFLYITDPVQPDGWYMLQATDYNGMRGAMLTGWQQTGSSGWGWFEPSHNGHYGACTYTDANGDYSFSTGTWSKRAPAV